MFTITHPMRRKRIGKEHPTEDAAIKAAFAWMRRYGRDHAVIRKRGKRIAVVFMDGEVIRD